MLSALGSTFAADLTDAFSAIGTTVGPYVLLVVGIVAAIIVVSFVMHFIRAKIAR
jgi:hypothetical protein